MSVVFAPLKASEETLCHLIELMFMASTVVTIRGNTNTSAFKHPMSVIYCFTYLLTIY